MAVRSATTPGRAEAEPGGTSIPTTMSVMANPMTPSANALQLLALKPPAGGLSERSRRIDMGGLPSAER